MMRGLLVAAVIAGTLATGCMLDPRGADRPARFQAGPNMRAINVPVATEPGQAKVAGRTVGEPDGSTERLSAVSVSLQFTMALSKHLYAGGEAEPGKLEREGSNFAGAYGILGAEHSTRLGSLGVEMATGWRGLRYEAGGAQEHRLILEPRVRGQLWIADQWTLGGAIGARLGMEGEWMAGLYLGVHSQAF